jgi:hypothetical protein
MRPPAVHGRRTVPIRPRIGAEAPLPVAVNYQGRALRADVPPAERRDLGVRQPGSDKGEYQRVPTAEEALWPPDDRKLTRAVVEDVGNGLHPLVSASEQRGVHRLRATGLRGSALSMGRIDRRDAATVGCDPRGVITKELGDSLRFSGDRDMAGSGAPIHKQLPCAPSGGI